MIITISGSQGQGKTTILNELEKKGYNVFKNTTARTILTEWGYTLEEVYKYPPLALRFQIEILKRQEVENDVASKSKTIYISERSYADIFAYTLFALGSLNSYNKDVNNYYNRCVELQKAYKQVVFLSGREYVPKNDGVRSTNIHFTESTDLLIESFASKISKDADVKLGYIETPELKDRVWQMEDIISEIQYG